MATATRGTATDSPTALAQDLCWLLARASHSLTTQLTDALVEVGLSPRAHCVLSTAIAGEYTQTALAQAVGLDKTTMVVTLDELEAAGATWCLTEFDLQPTEAEVRAAIDEL